MNAGLISNLCSKDALQNMDLNKAVKQLKEEQASNHMNVCKGSLDVEL